MFWQGLILGIVIGANAGLILAAMFCRRKQSNGLHVNTIKQTLSREACDEIKKICESV